MPTISEQYEYVSEEQKQLSLSFFDEICANIGNEETLAEIDENLSTQDIEVIVWSLKKVKDKMDDECWSIDKRTAMVFSLKTSFKTISKTLRDWEH
jgi:hypothetical protein